MRPKDALKRGKLNVYQDRDTLALVLMNSSKITKKEAFSLIDRYIKEGILKELPRVKGKPLIVLNRRILG